jgi:hypothetical protein
MTIASQIELFPSYYSLVLQEIAQAMRLYHKAETIALVFVVDATSSMGKHIKAVKTQISSIVEEMRTTNPQMKLHLGFIGYRDHSDASRFEVLPLSCDVSGFQVCSTPFCTTLTGTDPYVDNLCRNLYLQCRPKVAATRPRTSTAHCIGRCRWSGTSAAP